LARTNDHAEAALTRSDTPAHRFKIRKAPEPQPGRLNDKLRACLRTLRRGLRVGGQETTRRRPPSRARGLSTGYSTGWLSVREFVIGAAVRPLGEDHVIERPAMVLSLDA
jgi:hypothetical protein